MLHSALIYTTIMFITPFTLFLAFCTMFNFFDWGKHLKTMIVLSVMSFASAFVTVFFYPAIAFPELFLGFIFAGTSILHYSRVKQLKKTGKGVQIVLDLNKSSKVTKKNTELYAPIASLPAGANKENFEENPYIFRQGNDFLGGHIALMLEDPVRYTFLCEKVMENNGYSFWQIVRVDGVKREPSLVRILARTGAFLIALAICICGAISGTASFMYTGLDAEILDKIRTLALYLVGLSFVYAVVRILYTKWITNKALLAVVGIAAAMVLFEFVF